MLDVPFMARLIRVTLTGSPFPGVEKAISLLLGTCAQESGFQYTTQIGGGPAKGFFQCEPATESDIWSNYLCYQQSIADWFLTRCGMTGPNVEALEHNMVYQVLMARTHYYRCDPKPLPAVQDVAGAAKSWKAYYNTPAGHGTEAQYIQSYNTLVKPHYPQPRRPSHG